ncbi:hypothetical protein GOP47_0015596 [Adiantum capillus-veneris]|uniref:Uncharacterized protein n=1 Tax=Adiantum capillus-veneris TaxID=13818 RepID=A0A9D4ZDC5_ADICA|nr:hypothetical protein GOP47_0015596 [Adiantum capillus-veneris]
MPELPTVDPLGDAALPVKKKETIFQLSISIIFCIKAPFQYKPIFATHILTLPAGFTSLFSTTTESASLHQRGLEGLAQSIVIASLEGDELLVQNLLVNGTIDINYEGTVNLRLRQLDFIQHEETSDELKVDYILFKTDVTPLFAAAHAGHVDIVKRLLAAGADVNQRIFRGYAVTAAAREGHSEVLSILLKSGAYQPACEEAFLEACLTGQAETAELLMKWELARPEVLTSALVHASNRGFLGIVDLLLKSGVDINSSHRVLLRSLKPSLHSNLECTPLIAAIVSRQTTVVKHLLRAGARTDCKARLGAWSWDSRSEEVLRVGAGMAEPYDATCESQGRSLLCHAILCNNDDATQLLLRRGANVDFCICTEDGAEFRPIHLASKRGLLSVLKVLISHGCDLNAQTEKGETPLMLCVLQGQQECFCELLKSGADFAACDKAGKSVIDVAKQTRQDTFVYQTVCSLILSGKRVCSSDLQSFSPLHFAAHHGNAEVVRQLLKRKDVHPDQQGKSGLTAAMIAAQEGHIEVFKELIFSGADISMKTMKGANAMKLAEESGYKEQCEKVVCDAIIAGVLKGAAFNEIHFAAKKGNCELLLHLLKHGHSVNCLDSQGSTPLMACVREGHTDACKLLLSEGADCYVANKAGETVLSLARKNASKKMVEEVILDHIAKRVVLAGAQLSKHTKQGKGTPHTKSVKLLKSGVLSWGSSKKRNVLCMEASLGASQEFQQNRKSQGALEGVYTFRVLTIKGREIHFDASASFSAELWARGINLVAKEALASKC